jgi:predicted  nucleic acid-binding Zn-ribbon protein
MAKNCKLPPAQLLMTEIINYEIRAEEQRQVIQTLTAELAKRNRELVNLQSSIRDYMDAESALAPERKRSRRIMAAKNSN